MLLPALSESERCPKCQSPLFIDATEKTCPCCDYTLSLLKMSAHYVCPSCGFVIFVLSDTRCRKCGFPLVMYDRGFKRRLPPTHALDEYF
jgi:predicted RNA-binding Zn-ribbon protein involved in translation (DUF1610 family)